MADLTRRGGPAGRLLSVSLSPVRLGTAGAPFVLLLALLGGSILGACGPSARPTIAERAVPANQARGVPGEVASNVAFSDYAGTPACTPCHAEHVASWLATPMHNMTREAKGAIVAAPFDRTFRFKGDSAKLETLTLPSGEAQRFVAIDSKRFGKATYRITRVIGGHHREDYAGVPVASITPDAPALGEPSEEHVMPISFVYATKSFRYKGYSVMVKERPALRAGAVWNQTCIFCHNTPPHLSTVIGAFAGKAGRGYQGEVVDPLLPTSMRAKYTITDDARLAALLRDETKRLGADPKATPAEAVAVTRARFRASHLVETGIGCEACHLGSAEHVRDPAKKPSFEARGGGFSVALPSPSRAATINRVCARCHQVLFSGYEPTWEGGSRSHAPGGSHINSGEARDLMLGACATKLSCVECHAPHSPDATARLRNASAADSDALCTRCHAKYGEPATLRAHSHHEPTGEGARCVGCHMPKKNMALDGGLSRYHRIGSPTDPARVLLDRPLECALCHVDKSVASLTTTMETWWKKSFERESLKKLYGSLDANVIEATAERGKPHEQAVAFFLLGEAKRASAVPLLAGQLRHPYPLVGGYAKRALDAIAGEDLPFELDGDEAQLDADVRAWLGKWQSRSR